MAYLWDFLIFPKKMFVYVAWDACNISSLFTHENWGSISLRRILFTVDLKWPTAMEMFSTFFVSILSIVARGKCLPTMIWFRLYNLNTLYNQ